MKIGWEGINYTANTYLHNPLIYIHVYVHVVFIKKDTAMKNRLMYL